MKNQNETPKLKSLDNPSINEVCWFDDNYSVAILFEGKRDTDGRKGITPAVKSGEELLLEMSLDDAEFLFEELRTIIMERARIKYETFREMDKAYWKTECNMSDEEYYEREERINSNK
jgi:hypothetical protein